MYTSVVSVPGKKGYSYVQASRYEIVSRKRGGGCYFALVGRVDCPRRSVRLAVAAAQKAGIYLRGIRHGADAGALMTIPQELPTDYSSKI